MSNKKKIGTQQIKRDNEDDNKGIKYILESIKDNAVTYFEELDDESIEKINESKAELEEGYEVRNSNNPINSGLRIKSIGYNFDSENDTDESRRELLFKSHKTFLAGAAKYEQFCIDIYNQLKSDNDHVIKLVVGFNDKQQINCDDMLRSAYGTVKTEPYNIDKAIEYNNAYTAQIIRRYNDIDEVIAPIEIDCFYNWVDSVVAAHIKSNYHISVLCLKIDNSILIERRDKLIQLLRHLSGYKENNISIGTNTNGSDLIGLASLFTQNTSSGTSFQISYARSDASTEQLVDYIMCEIRRLETAIAADGGYGLQISVSAEDESVLKTISYIIGASLEVEGLSVRWHEKWDKYCLLLSHELCLVSQLPFDSFAGFLIEKNIPFSSNDVSKSGIYLGQQLRNGMPVSMFSIPEIQFNRHAFVCGMTGSGKTNTMLTLLTALNKPVLVIEPVKTEYRKLGGYNTGNKNEEYKMNFKEMRAGSENVLRINPFWFPEGSDIQFHIDSIKSLITSSFSLTAAMPNILEQCLYRIYAGYGWNIIDNRNMYAGHISEKYLYPTFSDLANEVEIYLGESEYKGETLATYKGALLTRLQSFTTGSKGFLLNTSAHPNYKELSTGNNVIELDALPDDSDKAIVMGSILIQYYQYAKQENAKLNTSKTQETKQTESDNILKHIIVIEEAHRLFKNTDTSNKNAEQANPQAQMVESLSNMMAEIRAYGEGIIIVDQCPTKISPDVIRNSNIKIIHRLDMKDDIELVESALLLKKADCFIPRLTQGDAMIRFEGMDAASLVNVNEFKRSTNAEECNDEHNSRLVLSWDYSFIADMQLRNEILDGRIKYLSKLFLNTLLYDDFNTINEVLDNVKNSIQRILTDFGLGVDSSSFVNSDYNHFIITGVTYCIENLWETKATQCFDVKASIKMLLYRILEISSYNSLKEQEKKLLHCFQKVNIKPGLERLRRIAEMQSRRSIDTKLKNIVNEVIYRDIVYDLFIRYGQEITYEKAPTKDIVHNFVDSQLNNYFTFPISNILEGKVKRTVVRLVHMNYGIRYKNKQKA